MMGLAASETLRGRTPSPGNHPMTMMEEDSPLPGAEQSSQSSPGSASDHMGNLPSRIAPATTTTTKRYGSEHYEANDHHHHHQPPDRRNKRLERNRESARLSRRRRKQYLEILEERVNQMCSELDAARRLYVNRSIRDIFLSANQNRHNNSSESDKDNKLSMSRTHPELRIATTFQYQQLKCFSASSSMQFVLWLTLQPDNYFRGGRAASERLSAARIGERILSGGTNLASPDQNMWPLFCNEVVLSYEQEEKVRSFQKATLQNPRAWLDRHESYISKKIVRNLHEAVQAVTWKLHQREEGAHSVLRDEQRLQLQRFALSQRGRLHASTGSLPNPVVSGRDIGPHHHKAVNQYILNEKLERVLETIPGAAPLVTGRVLKRLARRPSFESLSNMDEKLQKSSSSASLKRNISEMSMDDDETTMNKQQVPQLAPVDAEALARATVEQTLLAVADLLPVPPPSPHEQPQQQPPATTGSPNLLPVSAASSSLPFSYQNTAGSASMPILHERRSSFLPDYLNVVPEEMWPENAEDILLEMMEGGWAIGEGIDMDSLGDS